MQDSRLLEIFINLTKKEIRALGKFLNSPFHNQRKDVIALYDYLRQTDFSKNSGLLTKENIFPHIFPNEKFSEKKIRYTMSFLFQAIKDFLAIQAFQANKINSQIAVVQSFRKKGLERLFQQEWKNTATLLDNSSLRHQAYYYQSHLLENEKFLFSNSQSRGKTDGLRESANHLDQFFIINKLRQSARALSFQTLGKASFQPNFQKEVLSKVETELSNVAQLSSDFPSLDNFNASPKEDFNASPKEDLSSKKKSNFLDNGKLSRKNPAKAIYYHCYKILATENSLPYFQNLRQLIAQHSSSFPARELQDIYMFALNYCIKQVNAQDMAFGKEALELYQEGLQQAIFFENGYLSRFNYKNIVALGLGLKEFDWVAQFIEEYKPYLNKKYRESAYNYNLALLHYRTENYDQAMTLLQQVGTKDVLNNLTARRMLVIIYYDRGDFDALYSLLDSFQNYIYRKSGLDYQRRMYLNFIKFTRKLLQLEGMSSEQVNELRREIAGTKNVMEKDWLLGKIG